MNIAVVGTGYVGLVAGTCFAATGNDVVCVDIIAEKVAALTAGKVPIYEPGLEELVQRNLEEQRLSFTTDLPAAVTQAAVIFIAVGTPQGEDGRADIRQVLATAEGVARAMNGRKTIVNKSTSTVRTAQKIKEVMTPLAKHPFAVVSNPEFLKEGAAVDDFMKPDRVVLGSDDNAALEQLKELYEPFVRTGNPILVMDARSAEMSKYAANAMLATKISFINEVSNLCEKMGADVNEVRRAIGLDRRIGPHFIFRSERGERDARDQDLVHQRGIEPLRKDGRRRQRGAPRDRPRPAHRAALHLSRGRLRRLVFSQGRPRRDRHGRARARNASAPRGREGQRTPEKTSGGKSDAAFRQESQGQDLRAVGPCVQASHRRHARRAGDRRRRIAPRDRKST